LYTTFSIAQWYPETQSYDTSDQGRTVAAETSTIVKKFDKEKCKDQANFPFALTRHHIINTCGAAKTSPLNYITLKHAIGRARLTARFPSDYCSYDILNMATASRVDGQRSPRFASASWGNRPAFLFKVNLINA
jgi:hypothetical protein